MVVLTFIPSMQEAEAGGSLWVWGQTSLQELVLGQVPKLWRNSVLENKNKKSPCFLCLVENIILEIMFMLYSLVQIILFYSDIIAVPNLTLSLPSWKLSCIWLHSQHHLFQIGMQSLSLKSVHFFLLQSKTKLFFGSMNSNYSIIMEFRENRRSFLSSHLVNPLCLASPTSGFLILYHISP